MSGERTTFCAALDNDGHRCGEEAEHMENYMGSDHEQVSWVEVWFCDDHATETEETALDINGEAC